MIPFRVVQEFRLPGDLPSQAAMDRLLGRLRDAAPEGKATVALGLGRIEIAITVHAADAAGAAARAGAAAGGVIGGRAVRLEVEPLSESRSGSAASPRAACSDPS